MSKKPQRRRKAKRTMTRPKTFKLIVEHQPMRVSYVQRWMGSSFARFEFRSLHKPARRIPVSDTGYLSHYVAWKHVREARGPQAFAREFVIACLNATRTRPADARQLALFR